MARKKPKKQKSPGKKPNAAKGVFAQKFSGSKFYKQTILLLVSLGCLGVFFSIPVYKDWLINRVLEYYRELPAQFNEDKTAEEQLEERHSFDYQIVRLMEKNLPDSAVVLLPPQDYVRANFSSGVYQWAHSVWNYYFTGRGNYVNYREDKEIDFSRVTHAIFIRGERQPADPLAINLRQMNFRILVGPVINEENQQVEIHLVKIDSPETLEAILSEYQNP